MRIALVHDQLQEFGGAERVLIAFKKIFPHADLYTSVFNPNSLGTHRDLIKNWQVKTSWFGRIPIINRLYSPLRFLSPLIWESFNFSDYDLVISSSGSWMSKGIKATKPTIHVSYVHHPPRYLYGYETAIEWQKYLLIKIYGNIVNHSLRLWDFQSSQRVDYFIANSQETRRRIQKFYRRDATVIYPPVSIPKKISYFLAQTIKPATKHQQPTSNFYLTVSRLARAKHIDILIRAANELKLNLKIIGTGRDEKYLKSIAGPTIEFLGNIDDNQLAKLYQKARAFLFASVDEEFGIAPVEAMGYGLPVIAYKSGGLPETVQDNVNGFLFDQLTPDSIIKKVKLLNLLPQEKYLEIKKNARKISENFSEEKFKQRVLNFINGLLPS